MEQKRGELEKKCQPEEEKNTLKLYLKKFPPVSNLSLPVKTPKKKFPLSCQPKKMSVRMKTLPVEKLEIEEEERWEPINKAIVVEINETVKTRKLKIENSLLKRDMKKLEERYVKLKEKKKTEDERFSDRRFKRFHLQHRRRDWMGWCFN